jgi:hypothetical protein
MSDIPLGTGMISRDGNLYRRCSALETIAVGAPVKFNDAHQASRDRESSVAYAVAVEHLETGQDGWIWIPADVIPLTGLPRHS